MLVEALIMGVPIGPQGSTVKPKRNPKHKGRPEGGLCSEIDVGAGQSTGLHCAGTSR
jgi:hypothetical protein